MMHRVTPWIIAAVSLTVWVGAIIAQPYGVMSWTQELITVSISGYIFGAATRRITW